MAKSKMAKSKKWQSQKMAKAKKWQSQNMGLGDRSLKKKKKVTCAPRLKLKFRLKLKI